MSNPPPEINSEHKRARILEAALEVCGQRGVAGARMEEVAALAQVSKGTLYRFFQSKEDLFLATIISSYETGLRVVDDRLGGATDPRGLMEAILVGLVEVFRVVAPSTHVHYQAWGVIADQPELEKRLYGFLRSFHAERQQQFEQLIRAGQLAGQFRADIPAEVLARGIGAVVSGFFHHATFDPEAANPDALKACFDTLVLGLLAPDVTPRVRARGEEDA